MSQTIYLTDAQGCFTEAAPFDPRQAIPRGAAFVEPPATGGSQVAQWTGESWVVLPQRPQISIDRAALIADIDCRADAIRLSIVGDPVRVEEYRLARDEAAAYIAAGYAGAVPPTVQAWATAKTWTAQQAADDIAVTAQAWESALYAIRSVRLIGKEAVRNAASDASAQSAHDVAISQLAAIGG